MAMNVNRFKNLSNIEFANEKPYYKVNKGTLVFWKKQETSIDKYAVSMGFLVVGSYNQKGEIKYIILDPSDFLCKSEDDFTYNGEQTKILQQKSLEEFKNQNSRLKKGTCRCKSTGNKAGGAVEAG